jgi:hypothetical protein
MHPGSVKVLYRLRRVLIVAACAAPVLVLGGIWLLVTQVLLVPRVPDATTPAAEVVWFIAHEKGLPRLDQRRFEALLEQQLRRLRQDAAFRAAFVAEYSTSSAEEQKAFRFHLFDAFKPVVMGDIRRFHELRGPAREQYVDERIVAYNRMAVLWGDLRDQEIKATIGPTLTKDELFELLLEKTTEEERALGAAYAQAVAARVAEILADAALKQEFEARIRAAQP